MELIDKDAVVKEIERLKDFYARFDDNIQSVAKYNVLVYILSFLDTLEEKEMDEVKIGETQIYLEDDGGEPPYDGNQWLDLSCTEYEIPKALFKDGDNVEILIRKAQKGE